MAISTTQRSLVVLGVTCIALTLGAVLRGTIRGEGPNIPTVMLNVEPASGPIDPGPSTLLGIEEDPRGTQFVSADYYITGDGNCRVYFDLQDKANFHFLDRIGDKVSLGLSEAGIEQIFCSGAVAPGGPLRLARHSSHVGLFQSSKLILSAFDDRLIRGSAGFRMLASGTAIGLKVEPREDIHFADDFMIVDKKAAQWRGNGDSSRPAPVPADSDITGKHVPKADAANAPIVGDFLVKSLKNPLLSANAFSYLGVGHNIYSVVGEPWWDQYHYEAALRGPVDARIGLVFAFQDDKNYGLFRWTAKKVSGVDVVDPGLRELVRIRNGKEEVLQKWPGGYFPNQWYFAQVRVTYSRVSIAVDGHPLMEISDPNLTSGSAGVWCDVPLAANPATDTKAQPFQINSLNELMRQHAVFDDVRVDTLDGIEDNFTVPGRLSGGWLVGNGDWKVAGQAPATELQVAPDPTVSGASAKALIGDRRWTQYELECDVQPGNGKAGVVFLHRDEANFYSAILDGKSLVLARTSDGHEEIVDSAPFPKSESKVRLRATIKHGHLRVLANENVSVETFDSATALKGRAGVIASAGSASADANSGISFGRFRLSFLPEPEPLVTTNAIFEEEFTESWHEWTSPSSEWYAPRDQGLVDGRPRTLLWHRSQFPGDVELVLEPRDIAEPKYELALSVAKDGKGSNNGYVFRYKTGDEVQGSRVTTVQLFRQGVKVGEKMLPEERTLSSVAVRRCGKYIVGLVNGCPVLSYGDKQPLSGSKVAFYTQGVTVKTESAKIISDNFRNDLFSSAPTNWRTAGYAIAEVTNRWQCDPRWSFFSLKNDRKLGKPAVLWSKNLYPGDVAVEFFVGNKMEGERGTPYTYARDINVTICSDGSDLNKGYTFMFGGQGNSGSMILRNGVEVKHIARTIPTDMNFHRHWFAVKIEKSGGTLTFRVDRYFDGAQNELVFEDPNPISGDHLALWTYDHAIMISRVRISGDGGKLEDHPDWMPGRLKTPYDPPQ